MKKRLIGGVIVVVVLFLAAGRLPLNAQTSRPRPAAAAPKPAGPTVEDVIKLSKAGLSDDIIIQQIKKKGKAFDLTTDQLVSLKTAGVSERVIHVMLDPSKADEPAPALKPAAAPAAQPGAPESAPLAAAEPAFPTEVGVYMKKQGEWKEVLPEVVYWRSGGVAKTIATAGIVKGDVSGYLSTPSSRNSVTSPAEFLIVAGEGVAITEYQLLRLRKKDERREFRTMTGGVLHSQGGATRDLVPYEGKKVAPHVFSVIFPSAIGPGEYGFLPPGSTGQGGKIYSFRIAE